MNALTTQTARSAHGEDIHVLDDAAFRRYDRAQERTTRGPAWFNDPSLHRNGEDTDTTPQIAQNFGELLEVAHNVFTARGIPEKYWNYLNALISLWRWAGGGDLEAQFDASDKEVARVASVSISTATRWRVDFKTWLAAADCRAVEIIGHDYSAASGRGDCHKARLCFLSDVVSIWQRAPHEIGFNRDPHAIYKQLAEDMAAADFEGPAVKERRRKHQPSALQKAQKALKTAATHTAKAERSMTFQPLAVGPEVIGLLAPVTGIICAGVFDAADHEAIAALLRQGLAALNMPETEPTSAEITTESAENDIVIKEEETISILVEDDGANLHADSSAPSANNMIAENADEKKGTHFEYLSPEAHTESTTCRGLNRETFTLTVKHSAPEPEPEPRAADDLRETARLIKESPELTAQFYADMERNSADEVETLAAWCAAWSAEWDIARQEAQQSVPEPDEPAPAQIADLTVQYRGAGMPAIMQAIDHYTQGDTPDFEAALMIASFAPNKAIIPTLTGAIQARRVKPDE